MKSRNIRTVRQCVQKCKRNIFAQIWRVHEAGTETGAQQTKRMSKKKQQPLYETNVHSWPTYKNTPADKNARPPPPFHTAQEKDLQAEFLLSDKTEEEGGGGGGGGGGGNLAERFPIVKGRNSSF